MKLIASADFASGGQPSEASTPAHLSASAPRGVGGYLDMGTTAWPVGLHLKTFGC